MEQRSGHGSLASSSQPHASEAELRGHISSRHEALLADLKLHVETPTGCGYKPGLDRTRHHFADRLRAMGASIELMPGQPRPNWLYGASESAEIPPVLVARRHARAGATRILISGHLDTVHEPDAAFRSLTISPDAKTATGPGCVDMKGGLVIAIHALESLAALGVDCSWTVVLNSDEETGSYHSEAALRAAARGADLGLVLEPSLPDGSLVVERPGSGQFMFECEGKAAHVGRDFASGRSAVLALARCISATERWSDPHAARIVNVGPIEGGHATNVVPDSARAWGNARFGTPEIAAAIERDLRTLETPQGEVPSVRLQISFNRPAKPLTPATQRLALAAREVAESLGQTLPFGKTGGVCDGNILQDAGLPTIDTLGVRGGGLHTPQEWIELASLVERCQLLAVLVARLSSDASWKRP
ncbi:MAG: M20/M25/M40 family metallo-hydrolase [Phycisphaerales bacterium]